MKNKIWLVKTGPAKVRTEKITKVTQPGRNKKYGKLYIFKIDDYLYYIKIYFKNIKLPKFIF